MTDHSNNDPLDSRLRDYGERWRQALPTRQDTDLTRLGSRHRPRNRWLLVPAAAAAVAAVIIGAQATNIDSRFSQRPSETVSPQGVVPWAPLQPTHPRIPAVTIPAVPDPSIAAAAPLCQASELKVASVRRGPAMGTMYLNVRVTLTGKYPCRVQGSPEIRPLDHGQLLAIPTRRATDDSIYRHPVLITKQEPALLALSWAMDWCTTPVSNDTIRALLPNSGALTFKGFGRSPFCNGTPGSGPAPIMVKPFQPEKAHPAEVRSAYALVDVAGNLNRTVTAGAELHFTVTLTSRRRLVLDPCPDYTIAQYGPDGSQTNTFALNCAAIPAKDSEGRPYLPAGRPVRFAMETTTTDSVQKISWMLDTPDKTVQLVGALRVVRTGRDA